MTYKELTDTLVNIAQSHYNVRTSDTGLLNSVDFGRVQYPLVFFTNDTTEFRSNEIRYNFIMLIADIVDDNVLQQNQKLSNLMEITKDIISYLINGDFNADYTLDETSIVTNPFWDNLPDLTVGWETRFSITIDYDNSGCNLPFSGI
jgi:predicted XRE-type DNA-binding protein